MSKKGKKKKRRDASFARIQQDMKSDAFLLKYEYAISEVKRLLGQINQQQDAKDTHKSIEYITSRIKSPESAVEKLRRKGREVSICSMEKNLNDIAGVCVVCAYYEDVYQVAEKLEQCPQVRILKRKDYIRKPKTSGYRSLHLILGMPSHGPKEQEQVKVEVQIRTLAMDAWAKLDHELHYKKKIQDVEQISRDLKRCADSIEELDDTMQNIRNRLKKL